MTERAKQQLTGDIVVLIACGFIFVALAYVGALQGRMPIGWSAFDPHGTGTTTLAAVV